MPESAYIAARQVLLDALEAVREHLDALVLVGAQAVYLRTGETDLAIAPFTTDGDLAIDPALLSDHPLLQSALGGAGFSRERDVVSAWTRTVTLDGVPWTVLVDLLVPESLGGGGRRAARLPPHEQGAARKVVGREAALVDKDRQRITALDPADTREFETWVAGAAGLLVAKLHKIADRGERADRMSDKDALDVYRLLQATGTEALALRLRSLRNTERCRSATETAIGQIRPLFGSRRAPGCQMAVRNAGGLVDPDVLVDSLSVLANELVERI